MRAPHAGPAGWPLVQASYAGRRTGRLDTYEQTDTAEPVDTTNSTAPTGPTEPTEPNVPTTEQPNEPHGRSFGVHSLRGSTEPTEPTEPNEPNVPTTEQPNEPHGRSFGVHSLRGSVCHDSMRGVRGELHTAEAVEHVLQELPAELGRAGTGWDCDVAVAMRAADTDQNRGSWSGAELVELIFRMLAVSAVSASRAEVLDTLRGWIDVD